MAMKTWFITGTSRGFGREWALDALDRGDQVAAAARDLTTLDDLPAKYGKAVLPIRLDVTDRDSVFAAVKRARDYFGRVDVVVNTACGALALARAPPPQRSPAPTTPPRPPITPQSSPTLPPNRDDGLLGRS